MAQARGAEGRTSNRGFASMNQERQRQIASMGGKAVPDSKRSFSQNRDSPRRRAARAARAYRERSAASRRIGSLRHRRAVRADKSVPDEKRSFSQNPGLAAEAGRKGGQASHSGLPHDHEAPKGT